MFISDMWNNWKTFKKNNSNDHKNLSSMACLNTSMFKRLLDNWKADDQQKIPSKVQANKKKIDKNKTKELFHFLQIDWEVIGLEFTERDLSKRYFNDQEGWELSISGKLWDLHSLYFLTVI